MLLTFLDSGVIMAAARGVDDMRARAEAIVKDENRQFATSELIRLEVLPKAIYFKQVDEIYYYTEFFKRAAVWVNVDDVLLDKAYEEAQNTGLSALDALHITAALQCNAAEFVTTEKPTKPLHRVQGIKITTIHR